MKTLFVFMFASILALNINAQMLQNTYWRQYDTSNVVHGWFIFGQDTVFSSYNNITFTPCSFYYSAGNSIKFLWLNNFNCLPNDTGEYSYSVQNDTLRFTPVSEPCSVRLWFFTSHYFVQLPTGIEDMSSVFGAIVSPDPLADGIFNLKFTDSGSLPHRVYLMSTDGRKIQEENCVSTSSNHTINLQSNASGIYFLVMENRKGRKVIKLVR